MQKLLAVMLLGTTLIDSQTNSAYAADKQAGKISNRVTPHALAKFKTEITEKKEGTMKEIETAMKKKFDNEITSIKSDMIHNSTFAHPVELFLKERADEKQMKTFLDNLKGNTAQKYYESMGFMSHSTEYESSNPDYFKKNIDTVLQVFQESNLKNNETADKETLTILQAMIAEMKSLFEEGSKRKIEACFTGFSDHIKKMKKAMEKLKPQAGSAEATTRTEKYNEIIKYIDGYEAKIKEEPKSLDENKQQEIKDSATRMDDVMKRLTDNDWVVKSQREESKDSEPSNTTEDSETSSLKDKNSILDKIHDLLFQKADAEAEDEKGTVDPRAFIKSKADELKARTENGDVVTELKTKCAKNPKALHAIFTIASMASQRFEENAWNNVKGAKVKTQNYVDRKEAEATLCYEELKSVDLVQTSILSDVATIVLPETQNIDLLNAIAIDTADLATEAAPKAKDGFESKLKNFFQKCTNVNNGQVTNLKNFESLAGDALNALKAVSTPVKADDMAGKQECLRKWEMIRAVCAYIDQIAQKQKSQQGKDAAKKCLDNVEAAKKAEYTRLGL